MCQLVDDAIRNVEHTISAMRRGDKTTFAALPDIEEAAYLMFSEATDEERETIAEDILDFMDCVAIKNPHFKTRKSHLWRDQAKRALVQASRLTHPHETFPATITAVLECDATMDDVADDINCVIYGLTPDETLASI